MHQRQPWVGLDDIADAFNISVNAVWGDIGIMRRRLDIVEIQESISRSKGCTRYQLLVHAVFIIPSGFYKLASFQPRYREALLVFEGACGGGYFITIADQGLGTRKP